MEKLTEKNGHILIVQNMRIKLFSFSRGKRNQKHAKNCKKLKISISTGKEDNKNIIIPSKYLSQIKKRFPNLQYTESETEKL